MGVTLTVCQSGYHGLGGYVLNTLIGGARGTDHPNQTRKKKLRFDPSSKAKGAQRSQDLLLWKREHERRGVEAQAANMAQGRNAQCRVRSVQ